jgi:beta-galactosidase
LNCNINLDKELGLLGLVENKFVIGRDEFLPISAEIHYFRVPKRFWSICFDRLKKANFRIISSYVPWNLHEERPGEFDFQGVDNPFKDLIVFLELAREFGFKIILKPGPWIQSEWPGGGLPKYIFSDESLVARDFSGGLLNAKLRGDAKQSYQPSYLHPKYLNNVKRYLGGLVEAIQNYIFPKGPVFLIQLDDEITFGGNSGLFQADYNSHITSELFPAFLENKYGNIKELPAGYPKSKTFASIAPPAELTLKKPEQLVMYFDWLEFKGKFVNDYINTLKERYEALGVGCMFSVVIPRSDFNIPVPWDKIRGEKTILGVSVGNDDDYYDIVSRVKLGKSLTGASWSPQVATGFPQSARVSDTNLDYKKQRFVLVSSLAAGLKGLNYYMFIGRDHWGGSPLGEDGTVHENYDVIRKINLAADVINLNSTKSNAGIAIGVYRPYDLFNEIGNHDEFSYINDITRQTFKNLVSDLSHLKYDFEIFDLEIQEHFEKTSLMFVPMAEYMSETVQKKMLDLISKGMTIVFVGNVPHFNLQFKPAKVLSRGLGIETKPMHGPIDIEYGDYAFKSIGYSTLSGKGSTKTLAKSGSKVMGAYKKLGKGAYYYFGYDISAKGEPNKLIILKNMLVENDLIPVASCSDPAVDVVIHTNDKGAALYIINTDTNQNNRTTRKAVIAVDLARYGFRQSKVELMDILGEKNITTTAPELKDGLIFEIGRLDSRIYWIPKK